MPKLKDLKLELPDILSEEEGLKNEEIAIIENGK
jgi:hypothetical protein